MPASAESQEGLERLHLYVEAEALRASALHRLVASSIAIGLVWYLYVAAILEALSLRTASGPVALVLGSLLAYRILDRRSFQAGAYTYVGAVAISICCAAWASGSPTFLLFLALAVGITSLLVGPTAGFVAAIAVAALPSLASLRMPLLLPRTTAVLAAILAFLTALLLWVAMYPLRMALYWAWASYEQAQRQTSELREHRGRLNATLKDLDAAYRRLEAMASELERARQAAVEARRLKAEFAANISHELRTPLNLIVGFSEMMALSPRAYGDQPLPPAYRGDVQAIYYNAQHLSGLIDDVLDLSRIEAGRMGLVRERLSLAEVVAEATAAAGQLLSGKGLYLRTAIPSSLPGVEADRTRLRQVLINLLNNAARFTDQGGVTISAVSDERDVTLSVADTGVGIAEEDLPKIFEAFSQLDGSIRRRSAGAGLGLAISKRFVELHGGRMWVESRPGQGTTFHFSLPIREELGFRGLPPASDTWARLAPAQVPEQTLVVAGEEGAAQLLRRYLDGVRVLPAADGEAARQLALAERASAVVLVAPPGDGVWGQAAKLGATLPGLPVGVCSLRSEESLPGVSAYLLKPVTQERFLAALAALGDGVHSVLLVDDDPEVVRLLDHMVRLAPRAYRVLRAYGGAQALEVLRRRRPQAMVLDLMMPEVDGYAVLEEMRADPHLQDVRTIVVTALGREEQVVRASLMGVTRSDGLSLDELTRCLKTSLEVLRGAPSSHSEPGQPEASAG